MTPEHEENRPTPARTVEEIEKIIDGMAAAEYPSPAKTCDMVMKGGITSGVVYPLTVVETARTYRLCNIGGASAGAIAACLAAAAEHRRQAGGSSKGFQELAKLPIELGGKLESLFQPSPGLERPFAVLTAGLDPRKSGKIGRIIRALIRQRLGWFFGGLAVSLLVGLYGLVIMERLPVRRGDWWRLLVALLPTLALALVVAVLAAAAGLAILLLRRLPANDFGLCDGLSQPSGVPALTEWLADTVDRIAGMSGATPLVVGDLWGAAAVDAWRTAVGQDLVGTGPEWRLRKLRQVDLQVMTTDLTTRSPFRLPFENRQYFFDRSEMRRLFPERVVEAMVDQPSDVLHPDTGVALYPFPLAEKLPVVVLARMSLSFPGLICAVPLYKVDHSNGHKVERHLFSDGGISSNFPIHFFDRLLPTRPTFGINLQPLHPRHPDVLVYRPTVGVGTVWPRIRHVHSVVNFVGAILDTMQNWADTNLSSLKGYVDRVVEVRQSPDEGGLNLRMPNDRVLQLAYRGKLAGESLSNFDWDSHRVARYRIAMTRLTDALDHLRYAWEETNPNSPNGHAYPTLVGSYRGPGDSWLAELPTAVGGIDPRRPDLDATAQLVAATERWETDGFPALAHPSPRPAPDIRMSPR